MAKEWQQIIIYGSHVLMEHLNFKLGDLPGSIQKLQLSFADYLKELESRRGFAFCERTTSCKTDNYNYSLSEADLLSSRYAKHIITNYYSPLILIIVVSSDTFDELNIQQQLVLAKFFGIEHLAICIDMVNYEEDTYKSIKPVIDRLVVGTQWDREYVFIIPISAINGDNIVSQSLNMKWWTRETILDVLNKIVAKVPSENTKTRASINGVYKIKGMGDVLTGSVIQGKIKIGDKIKIFPLGVSGTISRIEKNHTNIPEAKCNEHCGFIMKHLSGKPYMGNIMVLDTDDSVGSIKRFSAQIQLLSDSLQFQLSREYVGHFRSGRCNIKLISWTATECMFEPQIPLVVDTFDSCNSLGRFILIDNNDMIAIGKVTAIEKTEKETN